MALQSTKSFLKRFDTLPPNRGNRYFVAPGTGQIYVAGQSLYPKDTNGGLNPLEPLATFDQAFTNITSGRDDMIVPIMRGNYTLTANQTVNKDSFRIVGMPGLNPWDINIVGVAGGAPLTINGRNVTLQGFAIVPADAAYGCLVWRGNYGLIEDVDFGWDGTNRPAYGIRFLPTASGYSASLNQVRRCRFNNLDKSILFGYQVGNYPGATDVYVEECRFEAGVTKYIDEEADAYHNNLWFVKNYFGKKPSGVYIDLNHANDGASEPLVFMGNFFADAAFTDADDIDLTSGQYFFVGNYDKAGLITAI